MKIMDTDIEGVYLVENFISEDQRGLFVKDYQFSAFNSRNLDIKFKEIYYSVSKKNVIRGMHFQKPPHEHEKLIHVVQGAILDVIIDLRRDSKTKGEFRVFEINDQNHRSVYIPKGIAHGFLSLASNTIMTYKVASEYDANSDEGIRFDSFGFDWHGVENPILSNRDLQFKSLSDILSYNYF